ncbi:MAG: hypothetical protein AAF401_18330 [Pseudomonadota bacterium]
MNRTILLIILAISVAIAGYTFYESWRLQDPEYQRLRTLGMMETPLEGRESVELDAFAALRPRMEGTREINIEPHMISFSAALVQRPEMIETSYLDTVFSVMKIENPPSIKHRAFVESPTGKVMPVYVWDDVAAEIAMLDGSPRTFGGAHVYTYSKGAAIIVDGLI